MESSDFAVDSERINVSDETHIKRKTKDIKALYKLWRKINSINN